MVTKSIKNIFKAGSLCCGMIAATMSFSSCNDFLTIYPTDKIVGEDFWKTKGDVDQMIDGCYKSMIAEGVQTRAIIWGAYRSDELVKRDDYNNTTFDNIDALNLLPTMGYCSWADFYKVINNCNIVLNHAAEVVELDPEFTQGDYEVTRAQMLALRSLCYFYLVRAFRDVPLNEIAYEEDSKVTAIAQSAPAVVLQKCLDDLTEARKYIMKSGNYGRGDWRNWGYITLDAVDAIMADIYMWRGSMTHDANDYKEAIACVDRVVAAKDAYYKLYNTELVGTGDDNQYHLYNGAMAQLEIFHTNNGNSRESILEWQYNGRNNSNTSLENHYYRSSNTAQYGWLMASKIFNSDEATANKQSGQKVFHSKNDYRYWNFVYDANNPEAEQLSVRKMVYGEGSEMALSVKNTTGLTKSTSRNYDDFRQNWVVYRLTDLMLLKAEALVAMVSDDASQLSAADSLKLTEAFNLVQVVNKRSMEKTAKDTLQVTDYPTKSDMELLVLAERERELCFEGKRWWDLMRYCYRGMTGVDINKTLADGAGAPALRKTMADFIIRKYKAGEGDAVSYKMETEPYLYWPIQESEMKVNNLLKQNPVWIQEKSTSKN